MTEHSATKRSAFASPVLRAGIRIEGGGLQVEQSQKRPATAIYSFATRINVNLKAAAMQTTWSESKSRWCWIFGSGGRNNFWAREAVFYKVPRLTAAVCFAGAGAMCYVHGLRALNLCSCDDNRPADLSGTPTAPIAVPSLAQRPCAPKPRIIIVAVTVAVAAGQVMEVVVL